MKETVKIFEKLIGLVIIDITLIADDLFFATENGDTIRFYHEQDGWENVSVDEVCGNLKDLIGLPLVIAEEICNKDTGKHVYDKYGKSYTWTVHRFATEKGSVQIRWYGSSNGQFSEKVDCHYNGKNYYGKLMRR